jgi:pumilio RNA-binding family
LSQLINSTETKEINPQWQFPQGNTPVAPSTPVTLNAGAVMGTPHTDMGNRTPFGKNYMGKPQFDNQGRKMVTTDDVDDLISQLRAGNDAVIVQRATDQLGSRVVQQMLDRLDPKSNPAAEERAAVMRLFTNHALTLSKDVFGNYLVQKVLEDASPAEARQIAGAFQGHVFGLAFEKYGCRVLQKVLAVADEEVCKNLARELSGAALECVKDQNANHVMQKCFECVGRDECLAGLVDEFRGATREIASHVYGCRVLQYLIREFSDDKTIMDPVLDEMSRPEVLHPLCLDRYGNYVIQQMTNYGRSRQQDAIVEQVLSHLEEYACHKFASNVLEHILQTEAGARHREKIVETLIGSSAELVFRISSDKFGNYFVQKLFHAVDVPLRGRLLEVLLPLLPRFDEHGQFGWHIIFFLREERLVSQEELEALGVRRAFAPRKGHGRGQGAPKGRGKGGYAQQNQGAHQGGQWGQQSYTGSTPGQQMMMGGPVAPMQQMYPQSMPMNMGQPMYQPHSPYYGYMQ